MPTRRLFLRNAALAMYGIGSVPVWLSRAALAKERPAERKKILIAIFQRGAVDGLNVVVPHGEREYYACVPPSPFPAQTSAPDSAIDLDGFFGLNPALHSLKPLWDQRQLAIVEAVGSPTRHARISMRRTTWSPERPACKSTTDGWLNRALLAQDQFFAVRAVSMGPDLPRSLRGSNQALVHHQSE